MVSVMHLCHLSLTKYLLGACSGPLSCLPSFRAWLNSCWLENVQGSGPRPLLCLCLPLSLLPAQLDTAGHLAGDGSFLAGSRLAEDWGIRHRAGVFRPCVNRTRPVHTAWSPSSYLLSPSVWLAAGGGASRGEGGCVQIVTVWRALTLHST